MKRSFVIPLVVGAAALVGAVLWWMPWPPALPPALPPAPGPLLEAPARTQADPVEVFQKAFWKRPTADDKILHAERREWDDANGVKKWDWHLIVEPSPALLEYLKEDNAFNLAPSPAGPPDSSAPAWFQYDPAAVAALGSARRGIVLMFGKSQNILHATGNGGGFRPGAPEPAPAAATPGQSKVRLPPTAPPDPRNP